MEKNLKRSKQKPQDQSNELCYMNASMLLQVLNNVKTRGKFTNDHDIAGQRVGYCTNKAEIVRLKTAKA